MSWEVFANEVELLKGHGLTHKGLIYAIGMARVTTGLKLSVLMKVLKDLREAEYTDEQLIHLSAVLSKGKIGEAKAVIASYRAGTGEAVDGLRRSTQLDLLRQFIEKNTSFTEVVEVDGKAFARNPNTGEVLSAEHAALMLQQGQEAISKVEAERPASNELLASRLQATVVVEYSNLLGPDNSEIECDICRQPIPEDDLLPLDDCGHLLHAACINEHIMAQVMSMTFPVTCPLSNCRMEISSLDLQERLSADDLALYEQNSFTYYVQQHTGDLMNCPTPKCSFVFAWSGDGPEFQCPLCHKQYCLTCRVDWHSGLTCEQFNLRATAPQLDSTHSSLANKKRFKQCLYCLHLVERPMKGTLMECKCGHKFCFKCGEVPGFCECRKPKKTGSFLDDVSSFFKSFKG